MDTADFDVLLKAWGVVYSETPWNVDPAQRFRRTPSHPLARAAEFAPGKKDSRVALAVKLSGAGRRKLMGRNAGLVANNGAALLAPRWAADPIPCRETRIATRADRTVHPMLARVDQAVRAQEERHLLRGLSFRLRYCLDGTDSDRVLEVNARMRQLSKGFAGIALKRYRDEVALGRIFVESWLSGFAQAAS